MSIDDDGFVTMRLAPPDPMFALASLWMYTAETQQRRLAKRQTEPLPLETPTQHDVWERLTSAGRLLLSRAKGAGAFTDRRPTPPNLGSGATIA